MNNEMTPLPECKKPKLRLVIWPDESLKDPVAPFPESDLGSRLVRDTAGAMIRALYEHYGVGLAAQQVGVPFQIFVTDTKWMQAGARKSPRVFLNPRIVGVDGGVQELKRPGEGCLSYPYDYRQPVPRHEKIELEFLDFNGNIHHEWFKGYDAIVIQHEFDHLLGKCFIDRLSRLKQDMAIRKARKLRRQYRNGFKAGIKKMKTMRGDKESLLMRNKAFEEKRRSTMKAE